MRVLVLDEEHPYPLNSGKRARSFNLYCRLAAKHDIHYVGFGIDDSEGCKALKEAGINPIAVPSKLPAKSGATFYARLLLNLLATEPYIVTSHYSAEYQKTVESMAAALCPDIIICEWTPYAQYVKELTAYTRVLCTHNIEADIWQRYLITETSLHRRWYIKKQWRKVLAFEKAAMHWVDGATAVSKDDVEKLAVMRSDIPIEVIENGVDLDYFKPGAESALSPTLVFTGSMDWRPNQDAVSYFLQEVFPLLKKRHRDMEVIIVGRDPPSHILEFSSANVTITGTVDDVRPYIERAAVIIVPLRVGGGSRLKILEAFAMRKAVVSTKVGAEGLNVIDGMNILLADTPGEMASKVELVMQDQQTRERVANAAYDVARKQYGWDRIAAALERFLLNISQKKRFIAK